MLYGDWIDLELDDKAARTHLQDAGVPVRAHGTGLSTATEPHSVARSGSRPVSLSLVLATVGNVIGGSLFIGGLVLAPFWLERLLGLL